MAIRRYPGANQDLVQQLMALKNQAQVTGQVKPDYAPLVQANLADTREQNYRDAMIGLQEKGLTLAQQKELAQENQFNQTLAQKGSQFTGLLDLQKQTMADQIAAADRARTMGYVNTGLGAALAGGYLYNYDPKNPRRIF